MVNKFRIWPIISVVVREVQIKTTIKIVYQLTTGYNPKE